MLARKNKPTADNGEPTQTAADKIAGALALLAVKDMRPDDAALKLDVIGFSSREISGLLGVGSNYVHAARHRSKKR